MLIGKYDYDTDIAVQREESFDMGLSEGKSRGSRQKVLETAKNLLQFGLFREKIAQATGLSKAEVESICNG